MKSVKSKKNIFLKTVGVFISVFVLLPIWLLMILTTTVIIATHAGSPTSPFDITGNSMLPTLANGRMLWTYPVKSWFKVYQPQRGDIVIVMNAKTLHNGIESDYIKRIIAVSGDELKIENGNVYLNGLLLDEPYLATKSSTWLPDNKSSEDIIIPNGYVFLMGDNRVASNDSRSIGLIAVKDIISYFPLSAQKDLEK